MKKLIFGLSFLFITLFMMSCKQGGGTDVGALTETYENRMDSLKITLERSYNATMDSMQSAHEAQVQELQNQVANASAPKQGINASKKASTSPGSKPSSGSSSTTSTINTTNTTPAIQDGKVDVTKRGGAGKVKNALNKVSTGIKQKVDVTKRGGAKGGN